MMDSARLPRILVLGHSFVWRMAKFVAETTLPCVDSSFQLPVGPVIQFHGIGGRTPLKLRQFDLSAVSKFQPTIVILEIGSNDLCDANTNVPSLANSIFQLVQLLRLQFSVTHIIVSQILPRAKPPSRVPQYNSRVSQLNRCLFHLLRNVSFATLWFHFPILRARQSVFLRDGIHLNHHGNHLLYHSYQKAILNYLGRPSRTRSNRHISVFRRPSCRHQRPQPYSRGLCRPIRQ